MGMTMGWLFSLYAFGFLIVIFWNCIQFSKQIKKMKSGASFGFLLIESLKNIVKGVLWPVLVPLTVIQMVFMKGALDDFNQVLGEYNGYGGEE